MRFRILSVCGLVLLALLWLLTVLDEPGEVRSAVSSESSEAQSEVQALETFVSSDVQRTATIESVGGFPTGGIIDENLFPEQTIPPLFGRLILPSGLPAIGFAGELFIGSEHRHGFFSDPEGLVLLQIPEGRNLHPRVEARFGREGWLHLASVPVCVGNQGTVENPIPIALLPKAHFVRGRLLAPDRTLLAGVNVRLLMQREGMHSRLREVNSVLTDHLGEFELSHDCNGCGEHFLASETPIDWGKKYAIMRDLFEVDGLSNVPLYTFEPGGYRGRVLGCSDMDRIVELRTSNVAPLRTRVDEMGYFQFANVPPGHHRFFVRSRQEGVALAWGSAFVESGKVTDERSDPILLESPKHRVQVQLEGEGDLSGARIFVERKMISGWGPAMEFTDGQVVIRSLSPRVSLHITCPGRESVLIQKAADFETVQLMRVRKARVHSRVNDAFLEGTYIDLRLEFHSWDHDVDTDWDLFCTEDPPVWIGQAPAPGQYMFTWVLTDYATYPARRNAMHAPTSKRWFPVPGGEAYETTIDTDPAWIEARAERFLKSRPAPSE